MRRISRERGDSSPRNSLASLLPPLPRGTRRDFSPASRHSAETPLLLSAITYVGVVMLMRIPRANNRGYLQPRIFPITALNAVAAPNVRTGLRARFRGSASPPGAAFIRVHLH